MDIEDLEEDYAVRQVVAINSAPRDFYNSIDGAFDGHLFQHPCRHVRVLGSDAATKEAKTLLKLMLELSPTPCWLSATLAPRWAQ